MRKKISLLNVVGTTGQLHVKERKRPFYPLIYKNKVKMDYQEEFNFHIWMQYEAYKEYTELKKYAEKNNIKIHK